MLCDPEAIPTVTESMLCKVTQASSSLSQQWQKPLILCHLPVIASAFCSKTCKSQFKKINSQYILSQGALLQKMKSCWWRKKKLCKRITGLLAFSPPAHFDWLHKPSSIIIMVTFPLLSCNSTLICHHTMSSFCWTEAMTAELTESWQAALQL